MSKKCPNCDHLKKSHDKDGCGLRKVLSNHCGCLMEFDGAGNHLEPVVPQAHLVDATIPEPDDDVARHYANRQATLQAIESLERVDIDSRTIEVWDLGSRNSQVGGSHYKDRTIQPWDVVDEYGLDFYRGGVLKYLLRAGRKGSKLEDLRKAQHYLSRAIEIEEKEA